MKVAIKFLTAHLQQKIPAIYIDLNGRNNYKYLINAPAHTQRFLKQNHIEPHPHHIFLFTKTETETISGLSSLMFLRPPPFNGSHSKIYGDSRLFNYLQELKYKLGYFIANFSYCAWDGSSRLGISNYKTIRSLEYHQNHIEIFQSLQEHIGKNVDTKIQNNALNFYDPSSSVYQDGFVNIRRFQIKHQNEVTSNFIFSLKSNPIFNLQSVDKKQSSLQSPNKFSEHFIVLHYKNVNELALIAQNQVFKKQLKDFSPKLVVHLIEDHQLLQKPQFQVFIKLFSSETEHIFANQAFQAKNCHTSIYSHYKHFQLTSKFSELYPNFFPNILNKVNQVQNKLYNDAFFQGQAFKHLKFHTPKHNYEYILQPQSKRGFNQITQSKSEIKLIENHNSESIPTILSRQSVSKMIKTCDPKVIFLGTAASYPNPYRNISSILVELQNVMIMFDCGQGSFAQFSNHFGLQLNQKLLKTRIVFITHCHSDHVLGIMQFISRRNKLLTQQNNTKLYLIIPANMVPWFNTYCKEIQDVSVGCQIVFVEGLLSPSSNKDSNPPNQQRDSESKVKIINSKQKCNTNRMYKFDKKKKEVQLLDPMVIQFDHYVYLVVIKKKQWIELIEVYKKEQHKILDGFKEFIKSIRIIKFEPIPVIHCTQSYAIILQHQSGIKISYSGDTRPVASFAKAANNSTLLIHQATFSDAQVNLAYEYFHSSVSEAIQIGMKSKSWKTALTHFSENSFRAGEMIDLESDLNWKKREYAKSHVFLCCDHLQTKISELDQLSPITKKISRELVNLSKRDV